MENRQSEFLQFTLFILATVWLVQKGSKESKRLEDIGLETKEQQQIGSHANAESPGWAKPDDFRTRIYENSLLLVMTAIWLATWLVQSLSNWRQFNEEQVEHREEPVSWGRYLLDPQFWERTLQTGSPSSSPSGRWPSSPSISASGARPNRNRSGHHTTRPRPPASTT